MIAHTDLSAIADLSVALVLPTSSELTALGDTELIARQKSAGELRRRADALAAAYADEIAHRSRRELGYSGLAQRLGQGNAESLIQKVTGTSSRDARSLVQAGAMLPTDAPRNDAPARPSWLAAVGEELAQGRISVHAAGEIQKGLGVETDAVSAGDLALAVATLLRELPTISLDQLGARARELRNDLDTTHVRDRAAALFDKRYLRLTLQNDGMTRITGLLDPESAATVGAVMDAVTSPRRGGPRFVDPIEVGRAEELIRDPRTTDQITLDSFVELVRIGGAVDDGRIVGAREPTVNILVTGRDLIAHDGMAFFPGQSEAVSIETAERHICTEGITGIEFSSEGQPLRLGRTRRLFNREQRRALAARDGGCRFPGCPRPVSWTEAHHINEWLRDNGLTDIEDGILLCRFHHLLVHNNGWKVVREGSNYFVVPPASEDPLRRPIQAPPKSPALRRLLTRN